MKISVVYRIVTCSEFEVEVDDDLDIENNDAVEDALADSHTELVEGIAGPDDERCDLELVSVTKKRKRKP
jgi:hypothetical protein